MDELTHQHMVKLREARGEVTKFLMVYDFALDEVNTKINILKKNLSKFTNIARLNTAVPE